MQTVDDIIEWAEARNLVEGSTPQAQMLKLTEEVGELAAAIARGSDARDAIGDCFVVLTILAAQLESDIRFCAKLVYEEIKDRKGIMLDGVFVRES
jgi:NTP pyrophosphatase (non-canonical NTP hydrolase)